MTHNLSIENEKQSFEMQIDALFLFVCLYLSYFCDFTVYYANSYSFQDFSLLYTIFYAKIKLFF